MKRPTLLVIIEWFKGDHADRSTYVDLSDPTDAIIDGHYDLEALAKALDENQ